MDNHELEVMRELSDMLFIKYKCLQCGIYVYKCEACEDYFFVRKMHFCYFERSLLLSEAFPPDEGFDEDCQVLEVDCRCMYPCNHSHLLKIKN